MSTQTAPTARSNTLTNSGRLAEIRKRVQRHRQPYLVVFFPLAFVVVFRYLPMYGLQLAFKDFMILDGIWGSPWIGFRHFELFFKSYHRSKR